MCDCAYGAIVNMARRRHCPRWLVPALAMLEAAVLRSAAAELPNYVEFHVFLNPNCSDQPIQISIDEPQPLAKGRSDGLDVGEERACVLGPWDSPQF